jgi:DNA polymerase III delta prime subunit
MEPESESRDLVHVEASSTPKTETDADVAPLIRKVGATSIAEIEKLIGELQATKNFLQSEADRIEREMARYMNLTQMASASVKIIFDTVSGWRQAGHPMREFEIMRSQAKDSTGRMEHPID